MTSITTEKTINELRLTFAQHGLPGDVVSDNGPQFVSMSFLNSCIKLAATHSKSSLPPKIKWCS